MSLMSMDIRSVIHTFLTYSSGRVGWRWVVRKVVIVGGVGGHVNGHRSANQIFFLTYSSGRIEWRWVVVAVGTVGSVGG